MNNKCVGELASKVSVYYLTNIDELSSILLDQHICLNMHFVIYDGIPCSCNRGVTPVFVLFKETKSATMNIFRKKFFSF